MSERSARTGQHRSAGSRVPWIRQVDPDECGAACLAMLLAAHGLPGNLAACRALLPPGPAGVDAASLADAARRLGLEVKAYRAEGRSAFEALTAPAIVHWAPDGGDGEHFVVLERMRGRGVQIVDPDQGRRRMRWQEFLSRATGVVVCGVGPSGAAVAVPSDSSSTASTSIHRLPAMRGLRKPVLGCWAAGAAVGGAFAIGLEWVLAAVPWRPGDREAILAWVALAGPVVVWVAAVLVRQALVGRATRHLTAALRQPAVARFESAARWNELAARSPRHARMAVRLRSRWARLACRASFDVGAILSLGLCLLLRAPWLAAGVAAWSLLMWGLASVDRPRLRGGALRGVDAGQAAIARAFEVLYTLESVEVQRSLRIHAARHAVAGIGGFGLVGWTVGRLLEGPEPSVEITSATLAGALSLCVVAWTGSIRRLRLAEIGALALGTALEQDRAFDGRSTAVDAS